MTVTFQDIKDAADLLEGKIEKTPLVFAHAISGMVGAEIFIKLENQQITSSFKDRGALNKLSSLTTQEAARGVVAMSAGNHAQSVAYHAKRLGIPATIVMPKATPYTKVERTEKHGAEVVLEGDTLVEAQAKVEELVKTRNLTQVHPFDDDKIIAGQGTVAMEMLEAQPDLEVLVVPTGGGGLISGCAIAAKSIKNDIEIIGAEAKLFPSMYHALRGEPSVCGGATLAEGIAVKDVAARTVAICKEYVDTVRLADETSIERAVFLLLSQQKTLAEGAAATSLAVILSDPDYFSGRKIGIVLTGGNIDPRILASISYRELEREQRIINLRFSIDDKPGILGRITTLLGDQGANVLEVSHHRMYLDISAKGAQLDIMLETRDGKHAGDIVALIRAEGFSVKVLNSSQDNA
ncbi:Threonine dehydratase, catabolic @ L-serine dehydratase, (PLP)-dependent [hydrothermal vent metagenome]|uniref:threonine ammonia-lyase n=1 Tax=hydrothermal vent metagenome TaxID=652676 RepID=A0A3B0RB86_9ZZZZ